MFSRPRPPDGFGNYSCIYNGAKSNVDLPEFARFSVRSSTASFTYQDPTTKNPMAGQTGWNYL